MPPDPRVLVRPPRRDRAARIAGEIAADPDALQPVDDADLEGQFKAALSAEAGRMLGHLGALAVKAPARAMVLAQLYTMAMRKVFEELGVAAERRRIPQDEDEDADEPWGPDRQLRAQQRARRLLHQRGDREREVPRGLLRRGEGEMVDEMLDFAEVAQGAQRLAALTQAWAAAVQVEGADGELARSIRQEIDEMRPHGRRPADRPVDGGGDDGEPRPVDEAVDVDANPGEVIR